MSDDVRVDDVLLADDMEVEVVEEDGSFPAFDRFRGVAVPSTSDPVYELANRLRCGIDLERSSLRIPPPSSPVLVWGGLGDTLGSLIDVA